MSTSIEKGIKTIWVIVGVILVVCFVCAVGYLTGAEPGDDPPLTGNVVELDAVNIECNGEHPEDRDPIIPDDLPVVYGSCFASTDLLTERMKFDFFVCMGTPAFHEVFEREVIVDADFDPETWRCSAYVIREEFQEEYLWHWNGHYTFACTVFAEIDFGWPIGTLWVELGHVVEWPYCPIHGNEPWPRQGE